METSTARVAEIERVSRDIDDALSTISEAAEKTRVAASGVSTAVRGERGRRRSRRRPTSRPSREPRRATRPRRSR